MLNIPTGGEALRRRTEDLIAEALRDSGADELTAEQLAHGIHAIASREDIPILAVLWWIEQEGQAAGHAWSLTYWRKWAADYAARRAEIIAAKRDPQPPAAA